MTFDDDERPLPPSQPPGWIDPDPLTVLPEPVEPQKPWVPSAARNPGCGLEFILPILVLIEFVLLATPRSAPIPTVDRPASERPTGGAADPSLPILGASGSAPPFGAPLAQRLDTVEESRRGGAPLPATATGGVGTVLLAGNASWADPSHGPDYLAVRLPRGTVVTIRGPGGAWVGTVNDYGPSARIDPPRVADIALGHWRFVCGLPASAGLCPVTIETVEEPAPLPRTDTDLEMFREVRSDQPYGGSP